MSDQEYTTSPYPPEPYPLSHPRGLSLTDRIEFERARALAYALNGGAGLGDFYRYYGGAPLYFGMTDFEIERSRGR